MNETTTSLNINKQVPKRFVSLDFARSIAIFLMLALHNIMSVLDINDLLDRINELALIQLVLLLIIPFFGGLAGFFLLVSAISNMISIYRDLENGKPVGSLVVKQVVIGILLLFFAMIIENFTGYFGLAGNFFKHLNNVGDTDWEVIRYRFNHFETIHTIAWCIILNGLIHGLLSINNNWQNRKRMIIIYVVLAVVVVGVTQPIWWGVGNLVEGYPFGTYVNGHSIYMPWIGSESWRDIFRAPFLGVLAGREEPVFPYLAVSFIGSIIGIVLSQPREKITKKFTKTSFIAGLVMFLGGLIGIVVVILKIANATDFDTAILFYKEIALHRNWAPDRADYVPPFSFLGQFFAVNGFSLLLLTFLFRLIEFRGKSEQFANKTKIIRRYGIVALSNYNNQGIYYIMFAFTSFILTGIPYQKVFWGGTFLNILLTVLILAGMLFLWEKIAYLGSFEWYIRTITNNVIPLRRQKIDALANLRSSEQFTFPEDKSKANIWFRKFGLRLRGKVVDNKLKWWQRGQIDVENTFYNAPWINFVDRKNITEIETENDVIQTESDVKQSQENDEDSRLAFKLAMIGLCSILFIVLGIFALFVALDARKREGINKHNKAALIISIITMVLLGAFLITSFILKISALGLF